MWALKMQNRKMQDWKMSDENARLENARLENVRLKNVLILFCRHRSTAKTALPVIRCKAQFNPMKTCLLVNCNQLCAV